MSIYRLLLHLLPGDRRRRHGDQMTTVFADLSAAKRRESGALGVGRLWISETVGLLRFSLREWSGRIGAWLDDVWPSRAIGSGPRLSQEVRGAWRGLRSRGWRGALVVALLALTFAANAIAFAAADSFVFNRAPYRDGRRLVEIGEPSRYGWRASIYPELVPVWRQHTDLFSAFHGTNGGPQAYIAGSDMPRFVQSQTVTPGLFEMLGARPLYGRTFNDDDVRPGATPVAILAEEIAAQEFSSSRLAIGQHLQLDSTSALIVGVMPEKFRFPDGLERIWLPMDITGFQGRTSVTPIARLAPGVSIDTVSRAVGDRAATVLASAKPKNQVIFGTPVRSEARPIASSVVDSRMKRLFILLCAAAGCLLLVACANVANLELATAVSRAKSHAVELALGASRGSLIRTVLLEGAFAIGLAVGLAVLLTYRMTGFIATNLPVALMNTLSNPIDIDPRTLWFMVAVAVVTWLLASLPVALLASRANVLDALKVDGRTQATSRTGTRVRHLLTTGEVAMTVLLLVGAVLNVRTYTGLLHLPKGFDSTGVVSVGVRQKPQSGETDLALQERLLAGFKARPDVLDASLSSISPPSWNGSASGDLSINPDEPAQGLVTLGFYSVGLDYFKTMRQPILSGRAFQPGEDAGAVIVDELFAKRFWPNGDAVGSQFNIGGIQLSGKNRQVIVGVAAHVRTEADTATAASASVFPLYRLQAPTARNASLSFVVRLKDATRIGDLTSMVKSLATGARVRTEFINTLYARMFADELLASSIMTAFGVFAFIVAMAGVYGVMAFLVAGRTREIGIRMALGADRGSVSRLVLQSSLRPVIAGAIIGLVAAVAAARWAQSLLFGVTSTDPWTYATVTVLVVATAMLATWQPARQAGRVDPSQLLRS